MNEQFLSQCIFQVYLIASNYNQYSIHTFVMKKKHCYKFEGHVDIAQKKLFYIETWVVENLR